MNSDEEAELYSGSRVLDTAIKALRRKLCDRCLGRLFARSGFGLTNKERGMSVRYVLALELETSNPKIEGLPDHLSTSLPVHGGVKEEIEVKEAIEESSEWNDPQTPSFRRPREDLDQDQVKCWVCEDIFEKVEELVQKVVDESNNWEFGTFLVGCQVDPQTVEREQMLWQESDPPTPEPLKEELNRSIGKRFWEIKPEKVHERSDPDIAFIVDPLYETVKTQVKPVFIYGRYRKLVRGIPQTRWPCRTCKGKGCPQCKGTGRMYETSVEELIGSYPCKVLNGDDFKLHGMGREDIDVLSLGTGRPFIIEISKPHNRMIDLVDFQERIKIDNGDKVEISDLRITTRKEVPIIKEGTTNKSYRALISTNGGFSEETLKYSISLLAQSPIGQRTPTRVAHRRADKVRRRTVYQISAKVLPDGKALVELTTEGGLYIKELLHGDGGRTEPSLSSLLGVEVMVESLDVTGVQYMDQRT